MPNPKQQCVCCNLTTDPYTHPLCDDCNRKSMLLIEQGLTPEKIAMGDPVITAAIERLFASAGYAVLDTFGWSVQRYSFKQEENK